MAWKNAHDALPAWLRSEIEKMAAAVEAAAEVRGNVMKEAKANAASAYGTHMRPVLRIVSTRELAAHAPRARPSLGAVNSLVLVVDNAHQTSSGARVSR